MSAPSYVLTPVQPGGVQPGGVQPGGVQPGGIQPGGIQPGTDQHSIPLAGAEIQLPAFDQAHPGSSTQNGIQNGERHHNDHNGHYNGNARNDSGPLKEIIAHQDSLYKYISWEDPVRTLGTYIGALSILCGAHYIPLTQYAIKAIAIVLGVISVAEFASRSFGPNTFLARLRPKQYKKVPEQTLNATLKDIHDFVQYGVVQAQRIVWGQDLDKTFGAFLGFTALFWLIKVVPPFWLAILGLTSLYIAPLVASPRAREVAQDFTAAAAEKTNALAKDGTAKAAELTNTARDAAVNTGQRVGNLAQNSQQAAANLAQSGQQTAANLAQSGQQAASNLAQSGQQTAANLSNQTKNAASNAAETTQDNYNQLPNANQLKDKAANATDAITERVGLPNIGTQSSTTGSNPSGASGTKVENIKRWSGPDTHSRTAESDASDYTLDNTRSHHAAGVPDTGFESNRRQPDLDTQPRRYASGVPDASFDNNSRVPDIGTQQRHPASGVPDIKVEGVGRLPNVGAGTSTVNRTPSMVDSVLGSVQQPRYQ